MVGITFRDGYMGDGASPVALTSSHFTCHRCKFYNNQVVGVAGNVDPVGGAAISADAASSIVLVDSVFTNNTVSFANPAAQQVAIAAGAAINTLSPYLSLFNCSFTDNGFALTVSPQYSGASIAVSVTRSATCGTFSYQLNCSLCHMVIRQSDRHLLPGLRVPAAWHRFSLFYI